MMLITNNKGGFFLDNLDSKFRGLFLPVNNQLLKIIDHFEFQKNIKAKFSISENSLILELNKKSKVKLFLDTKKPYDNSIWGRSFLVFRNDGSLVFNFKKISGNRRDFAVSLLLNLKNVKFKKVEEWVEQQYFFDQQRNSPPFERFSFHAVDLEGKKFVFSVGNLIEPQKQEIKVLKVSQHQDAFTQAVLSLNSLRVNNSIYAGLPWFFQFWSRDELISTIGFIKNNQQDLAKNIILKYINNIQEDGRLENIENSKVTNADAIGWLFKRVQQLKWSPKQKKQIKESLDKSIKLIQKNFSADNLIFNNPKETWMDSEWENDNRQGIRIEIQALFLNMLKLSNELNKKPKFKTLEKKMREEVRNTFFRDGYLYDGKDDPTIRPNIFLAYYIYPDLLSDEEWISCFDQVLPRLWLDWGGLASIDIKHPLFCSKSSGESPQSYHRGDSWFWINNLAALCMLRLDRDRYSKQIAKILEASTKDLTKLDIPGHHSEISDAENLSSKGCLSQAWSSALLIELLSEF